MTQQVADPLEEVIRQAGEAWLIDWYAPKEQALPRLRQILSEADEWSRSHLGKNGPTLTPEAIVAEYTENPHR